MHASIPTTHVSLIFVFYFLFSLFFLVLPPLLSFLPSPFTVHSYRLLYYLSWWDLPFLPLNCFWLLMGVLLRLPTNLPATQPLPLL